MIRKRDLALSVLFLATCGATLIAASDDFELYRKEFKVEFDTDIAKSKTSSLTDKQRALKDLADLCPTAGALCEATKDAYLKIIAGDPEFFFREIQKYPDNYKDWFERLNFNWLAAGPSEYPALKQAVVKSLEQNIEESEQMLKTKKAVLNKVRRLKTTVVDQR